MLHLVLVLLTSFTAAALGRDAQARAPQASPVPNLNKPYAPAYFCPSPTNNYQQWTHPACVLTNWCVFFFGSAFGSAVS
ncbi:hypothetical protein C8F01DRAFT_1156814 [Mycena amicta]|nr:hypothetical protein C8F01DRAFT_1156814 [Mycena amicta]